MVSVDPVRKDTSASAFRATQPFYKTCYRRSWLYAKIGQLFVAQKTFVAAMQASHMHHKFQSTVRLKPCTTLPADFVTAA